jgi:hypothetical protein
MVSSQILQLTIFMFNAVLIIALRRVETRPNLQFLLLQTHVAG